MRTSSANGTSGNLPPLPMRLTGAAATQPQTTPGETLARWAESLLPKVLAQERPMARLLEELSRGVVSEEGGHAAADVFDQLIRWEKFDLLVEVFNRHHDIQQRQATLRGEAEPYKTSLTFAKPAEWDPDPGLLEKMCDAFRRIRVDTLEILSFYPDAMASTAMSRCILAFLEGGTTSLTIDTALSEPHLVADALADAPLTTLRLGVAYQPNHRPPEQHLDSHRVLLSALARSHTLETLYLGHAALTSLHEAFALYDGRHGAPLKAIELKAHPVEPSSPGNDIDRTRCVSAIRSLASVAKLEVQTGELDLESLRDIYLTPLSGHQQLTRLELLSERGSRIAGDARFLPELARFAVTCPSLTHFHASINASAHMLVSALNTRVRMGEDIDPATSVHALKQTLNGKVLPLQSLKLRGFYLSAGLLNALFAMVTPDGPLRSLKHLDLSGCLLDLRTTVVDGSAALTKSRSLETIQLPSPYGFCVVDLDRELQAFRGSNDWDQDVTDPSALASIQRESSSPHNRRAVNAMPAALRNAAAAFLRAPQQTLDEVRAQWLNNADATPRLAPELETALAAARQLAPRMAITAPAPRIAAQVSPTTTSNTPSDFVATPLSRTAQNGPNAPAV